VSRLGALAGAVAAGLGAAGALAATPADAPGTLHFTDVTAEAGARNAYTAQDLPMPDGASHVGGVAWRDVDGDGLPDLFLMNDATRRPASHARLLRNLGDGRFEDITVSSGITVPHLAGGGAAFADYDNDGAPDLYVATAGPNRLFRNDGRGHFTDVTEAAGVGDTGRGQSASWADYDGDGDLDLYVANWDRCVGNPYCAKPNGRDALYRNEGNGRFVDVAEELFGVEGIAAGAFVAGWLDADDDGDPDLLVINDSRHNALPDTHLERHVLWRNDGPGGPGGWRFTDVTLAAGMGLSVNGMGLAVGDYDRDGHLDVFTSNIRPAYLMRNLGGTFVDVTDATHAWVLSWSWGATFLDVDNDGWLDLFVATGFGTFPKASRLLHNLGTGAFADVTAGSGVGDEQDNRAVAAADYDLDGDVDLYVPRFGEADADGYAQSEAWGHLFRNDTAGGHWLTLRLEGRASNRDAIGARVTVAPATGRPILREVMAGTAVGSSDEPVVHVGLGADARPPHVLVRWPAGEVEDLGHLEPDRAYSVVEGEGTGTPARALFLPLALGRALQG
jgi:hypothetical protein